MSHHGTPLTAALSAAALSPAGLAQLERVLAAHWDADGVIAAALATRPESHDPTRPRSLSDVAREVAGILAASGTESNVSGYLKREELALFGALAATQPALAESRRVQREHVRGLLWRTVRGLPEAAPGLDVSPASVAPSGS